MRKTKEQLQIEKEIKEKVKEEVKIEIAEEIRKEIKLELTDELQKKKKRSEVCYNVFDTLFMLMLTACGILMAKYIPEFREGNEIAFVIPSVARLIMAFILSMVVMGVSEARGGNIDGKKKNFLRRCWFAVSNGLGWYTLLGF